MIIILNTAEEYGGAYDMMVHFQLGNQKNDPSIFFDRDALTRFCTGKTLGRPHYTS